MAESEQVARPGYQSETDHYYNQHAAEVERPAILTEANHSMTSRHIEVEMTTHETEHPDYLSGVIIVP